MTAVALEYRRSSLPRPHDPPAGIDGVVDGWIGRYRRRATVLRTLRREAEFIDSLGENWRALSDEVLRRRLGELRERFRRNRRVEVVVPEALAAIREASARTLRMRPFVVQLMGALALHRGYLAEMATGEGKTLTAAVAAVLTGWSGRPCHIVTVNDYLAERDAEWLHPLYEFCGVSVGCVVSVMSEEDRTRGYAQDVTYTTSKEVTADFLRDRLRMEGRFQSTQRLLQQHLAPHEARAGLVMRGLHTAIIDEADSVLIDEAVTPLIISSPRDECSLRELYGGVWKIANQLHAGEHYVVDLRYGEIRLLPRGQRRIEELVDELPARWRGAARPVELVEQSLTAREFFKKGKQYVVDDGKVVIVDEFTGRMMPMRKWRHGLHQAIEAKEGVPISSVDQTLARISFQRFFRLYRSLSGMTGTAREAAGELWRTYRLSVVPIPTNRPVQRRQYGDRLLRDLQSKYEAIIAEVVAVHARGRPVLVGTRNVSTSEFLAGRLRELGLEVNLLNALNDRQEAVIVAAAGQRGAITIATNMAGRGTDILLGEGVAEFGGLHVIASERHESGRIDRQLFGRAARQGDPGSAIAIISLEDELVLRFAPRPLLLAFRWILDRKPHWGAAIGFLLGTSVQAAAQAQAFRSRRAVMKMDVWLDEATSFSSSREP